MLLKKIIFPLTAFVGMAVVFVLFAIAVNSRSERVHTNRDANAALHKMRFSLASSSESLSNAVLSKVDSNAEKFGQEALQKIEDFKKARQQLGQDLRGTNDSKLLHDIDQSFAKFEEVCETLVQSSKQNSNRKAYALAVGPCLDMVTKLDGQLARVLETGNDARDESHYPLGVEVYEARLALLRIQSILLQHIFEATDGVMDSLESKLQLELSRIKHSLTSELLISNTVASGHGAEINNLFGEIEKLVAEIVVLSRQNSNVHAEEIAMTARLEAVLNCETRLNVLEQMLQKQLESLLPKGREK